MARVAAIGDRTSVIGYRGLGLDTFETADSAAAREAWPEIMSASYDVIFVTEDIYEGIADLVFELAEKPTPAVAVVPGAGGGTGIGGKKIKRIIEKAIGTDVLIREEEG